MERVLQKDLSDHWIAALRRRHLEKGLGLEAGEDEVALNEPLTQQERVGSQG